MQYPLSNDRYNLDVTYLVNVKLLIINPKASPNHFFHSLIAYLLGSRIVLKLFNTLTIS